MTEHSRCSPTAVDSLVERLYRSATVMQSISEQKRPHHDPAFIAQSTAKKVSDLLIEARDAISLSSAATVQPIESECCREEVLNMEPCSPFAELQNENEALEARLAEAVAALKRISDQKLSVELSEEEFVEDHEGDFEGGYNSIIEIARAAIKRVVE